MSPPVLLEGVSYRPINKAGNHEVAGLEFTCLSCEPHVYLEPPQPLSPAGFSTAFLAASAAALAASSSAFFFNSSSVRGAVASFLPSPPAACSTAFSALPALVLVALQPLVSATLPALPVPVLAPQPLLPAAWAPGKVMPPALIRPAIPRPARSFFKSLQSIVSSFLEVAKDGTARHPPCPVLRNIVYFMRGEGRKSMVRDAAYPAALIFSAVPLPELRR